MRFFGEPIVASVRKQSNRQEKTGHYGDPQADPLDSMVILEGIDTTEWSRSLAREQQNKQTGQSKSKHEKSQRDVGTHRNEFSMNLLALVRAANRLITCLRPREAPAHSP